MIKLYAFWFAGLLLLTFAGGFLLPLLPNAGLGAIAHGKEFSYWLSLAQWDGGHYLEIAQKGYVSEESYAFFPLYPILIKIFSFLTFGNYLVAALLISNIAFALFLYKFYNYVQKLFSAKVARNTFLTFLLFPTTFICILAYSESLLLLLTIMALESIADKKLLKASVLTSLATFTRFIGIGLIAAIISEIVTNKSKFKPISLLPLFVSFAGIAIFAIFSYLATNDPIRFINVQTLWQRQLTDPVSTLLVYIWSAIFMQFVHFNDYLDLLLTVGFFIILLMGSKKIPLPLWIFSMIALLVPTFSGTFTSMPRYLLASIGAFVIVGDYLESKPALKVPLWSIMLALQAVLAAMFINGHWVA